MPLTLKISGASLAIITFAVSLLVFLTYFKYSSTLFNLISSRFQVVVDDVENTISNGLSLGVNLPELNTTQQVIQNVKNKDPQILSIKVFELISDTEAKTVFNTRKAGIGGSIPEHWLRSMSAADPEAPWHIRDGDANVVGTNLINNFGKVTGGIAVRYSQSYMDSKKAVMLRALIKGSLIVFIITCIVIFFAAYFFFRPLSGSFSKMRDCIDRFMEGEGAGKFKAENTLEAHFATVLTRSETLIKELEGIHKEVSKKASSGKGEK